MQRASCCRPYSVVDVTSNAGAQSPSSTSRPTVTVMGCGASFPVAEGVPPRRGWTGNRRAPSRTRAPTSPAGTAGASTGGAAPAAGARGIFVTTTPSAAARHSQQAYEVLRIEAGMAATPMGHLADEFKFFCPLCMCADALTDSPLCLPPW